MEESTVKCIADMHGKNSGYAYCTCTKVTSHIYYLRIPYLQSSTTIFKIQLVVNLTVYIDGYLMMCGFFRS